MALVTGEASHLGCTLANGMAVCCFFLCTCDRCEHMWNSQVVLTVVCHILYRTAAAASAAVHKKRGRGRGRSGGYDLP